jgi:hypothetical protein
VLLVRPFADGDAGLFVEVLPHVVREVVLRVMRLFGSLPRDSEIRVVAVQGFGQFGEDAGENFRL